MLSNSNTYTSHYDDILKKFKCKKGDNYTNTRIGDETKNIYGGTYFIEYNEEFWDKYYEHVFVKKNKEYLTEKQDIENGPLLVDIDLRYSKNIKDRQHNKGHIIDLVYLYCTKLGEIYKLEDNTTFDVYIMERTNVTKLDDKTKDGIHLLITLSMHNAVQVYLRKKILEEISDIWDLPIENTYNDVFDEGISKGFVNWQLYGSRKPGCGIYEISYHLSCNYSLEEDEWNITENNVFKVNVREVLPIISARYDKHLKLELLDNEFVREAIENEKDNLSNKKNKTIQNTNLFIDFENIDYTKITNINELQKTVDSFLETLSLCDYEIKETHKFCMVLPESYYGDGSYSKWIRVGWALKNTHEKLFVSWMLFSAQSKSFDFSDIEKYYNMWKSFNYKNTSGLTNRSIMYWAKNDNYKEYEKIRNDTISHYIEDSVQSLLNKEKLGEFDLANIMYQMCKDQYVCVSVKNNMWYEYKKNKWQRIDSGNSLRLKISRELFHVYMRKSEAYLNSSQSSNDESEAAKLKLKSYKLTDISIMLKTTSWKNNIMREAKEIFHDDTFVEKLDSNPYLFAFNNYVIDFKNKTHRKGKPDDYISKTSNIDYIPFEKMTGKYTDTQTYEDVIAEINEFMEQLFPVEELRNYMWEHLASSLIGTTENQNFNIYTGSGANGKSKLVELMTKVLGEYKATVPVTLLTQSRNGIGSTSPEIVQLMGVRYACMQEPSKGDKINEGIMKEITAGDPLTGRALFQDSITFIPQFKLVVCTNVLPELRANDDGTWRRIRVVDFMSKFNHAPYQDEDKFPRENYPYQFKVDTKLDHKFDIWAPVFASILVKIAYEKDGIVKDVKSVTAVSDKYRNSQDYLNEFIKEKVERKKGSRIKKQELTEEFRNWYGNNYGRNSMPNGKEICDLMEKMYGKCNKGSWMNVAIIYNYDDDDIHETIDVAEFE